MRTLRKDKEMIKIQYKKVENDVWYREYLIYINNKFVGWICKYNKTDKKFNVFSSKLHITTSDCNDYFKTLREAKKYIKQKAEIYFMGVETDDNKL